MTRDEFEDRYGSLEQEGFTPEEVGLKPRRQKGECCPHCGEELECQCCPECGAVQDCRRDCPKRDERTEQTADYFVGFRGEE